MSKTLKFHAGKVQYDEDTKRCTPLAHKGVISIKPSSEDPDFLAFTWTPKSDTTVGGTVEKDELLLIPGDVSFKHMKSCTTGRVFALTFLSSGAKHLYWLQDVGDIDQPGVLTEKDLGIVKQINELITINEDEDEDEEDEVIKEEKDESSQQQQQPQIPITSIGNFLQPQLVQQHLDKLSPHQIDQLSQHLPASTPATKTEIAQVVRSGFFQQSQRKLSEQLSSGLGAGYLVAQSLKYDYKGEGVDGFLNGIRELTKKEDDDGDDVKPKPQ
ncbi:uncharacterized protein CANTADRAFT_47098 [Suhomyces tanzawaensis NRRL Y-17324]|uniref:Adhesion regulating molecule n=1 Tax=Suhomyces tanzawaensis NRRL Y-17324 TaxID=984487 RepID=A0A1E4SN99_9ASCO|nr:uncharacterized protein CANTADRAFT_47098 [Suhomyces tanzawaensis NRRL Y-17324]ODV80862.1 hypothetical protein CANTADRAFT_47098 [Suhomyces tanzawaensis NRRL Y-17324]